MSVYSYWIGRDINYDAVWSEFERGRAYEEKFLEMRSHLLTMNFEASPGEPAFDFEALFKTIKGNYHDLKREVFSQREYDQAGPLFLYSVERGSKIIKWLGELRPILNLILFYKRMDRKMELENRGRELDNDHKHLENIELATRIMRENGIQPRPEEMIRLLNLSNYALTESAQKVQARGLTSLEVSVRPVRPDQPENNEMAKF